MRFPEKLEEKITIPNILNTRLNIKYLEINPVKVDIKIILTMPPVVVKSLKSVNMKNLKNSLKNIKDAATLKLLKPLEKPENLLDMKNYKKEVIAICQSYGENISDEIICLDNKLESLKNQSIIVPEKKAKKMLKQANREIQKKFSCFEKDILKAVEDELKKHSRTWQILNNTKADVKVTYPGRDVIKGIKNELNQVAQAGKGLERIEIVKKNLYKKLEDGEKIENLKMPKLAVDIGIIIEKGVAFFLKKNPDANKKLIYKLTDIADKKIIKLVDKLQDELKYLDSRAGEGVMEYRIQFRVWERERKRLLEQFKKGIESKFQNEWKNFVNKYDIFKNTKFKVDMGLIMGGVGGPSKPKSGALTPVQIMKMLNKIVKKLNGPEGLVKKSKSIDDGFVKSGKILENMKPVIEDMKSVIKKGETHKTGDQKKALQNISGSGEKNTGQSKNKQIFAWIKEIDNLKNELESFKKDIKEIYANLQSVLKSTENITKKLTDKSQAAAFKNLNKLIEKNSVKACEKLEKDIDEPLGFYEKLNTILNQLMKNQDPNKNPKIIENNFYVKIKKLDKMIKANVQAAEDIIKKKK